MCKSVVLRWWQILVAVRELEAPRSEHLVNLQDCCTFLRDIHWVVTIILKVAIMRHERADLELSMFKSTLHRKLLCCPKVRFEASNSELVTFWADYDHSLAEIKQLEKESLFKMFEILSANLRISEIG